LKWWLYAKSSWTLPHVDHEQGRGLVRLLSDDVRHEVAVDARGGFEPKGNPLAGRVTWTVRRDAAGH
jgi:hypothetical protein